MFGLYDDRHHTRISPDRFTEARPRIDVFALYREGLLTPGASATLQCGPVGYCLATRELGIWIGGQPVAVRSHTHLPLPVFICPACRRDCYRVYEFGGAWACRTCHHLDYASRHLHRSVRGYARLLWLQRRLGVGARPFASLPDYPRAPRKRAMAAEVRALEAQLISQAGGINRDLGIRLRHAR